MDHTYQLLLPAITVHLCRLRRIEIWEHEAMPAPFWRFYWNPTPGAWIERCGERFELKPGRWVLASPGGPLRTGNGRPFEHFFVHFTFGRELRLRSERLVDGPVSKELARPLAKLRHAAGSTGPPSPAAGQLVLQCLCHALAQIPDGAWQPPITDERIRTVVERIHTSRKRIPDTATLAKTTGMHPKSMSRLFRQQVGLPPHRYGLACRLDGAMRSLLHESDSVETVAADWGFHDRFHLTRLLSKHRGTTPGRLRRMEA